MSRNLLLLLLLLRVSCDRRCTACYVVAPVTVHATGEVCCQQQQQQSVNAQQGQRTSQRRCTSCTRGVSDVAGHLLMLLACFTCAALSGALFQSATVNAVQRQVQHCEHPLPEQTPLSRLRHATAL
jgi:hypothetical protein